MYKEREHEMDAISVLAIGKDLLHQRLGTYQVSLCTRCTQDMEFSQALSFTSSEYMCFYVLMYGKGIGSRAFHSSSRLHLQSRCLAVFVELHLGGAGHGEIFIKVAREMPWAQKDVCAVAAAAAKVWER